MAAGGRRDESPAAEGLGPSYQAVEEVPRQGRQGQVINRLHRGLGLEAEKRLGVVPVDVALPVLVVDQRAFRVPHRPEDSPWDPRETVCPLVLQHRVSLAREAVCPLVLHHREQVSPATPP